MGKQIYSQGQIDLAQKLRKCGYSYQEIADSTGMKLTSAVQHTHFIEPNPEANHVVKRSIKDLISLLEPGDPFLELPIPKGLLALWQGEIASTASPKSQEGQPGEKK